MKKQSWAAAALLRLLKLTRPMDACYVVSVGLAALVRWGIGFKQLSIYEVPPASHLPLW